MSVAWLGVAMRACGVLFMAIRSRRTDGVAKICCPWGSTAIHPALPYDPVIILNEGLMKWLRSVRLAASRCSSVSASHASIPLKPVRHRDRVLRRD